MSVSVRVGAAEPDHSCTGGQPCRIDGEQLPAGARVTGRLRRCIAVWVAEGLAVSVAGGALLSWPVNHAAWVLYTSGHTAGRTKQAVTSSWLDAPGSRDGPACRSSQWTRARPTGPPCARRSSTPRSSPTATTLRLASGAVTDVRAASPGTATIAAAARPTRHGWHVAGCCAAARRLSPTQFARMWNDLMDGDPSTVTTAARIAFGFGFTTSTTKGLRVRFACTRRPGQAPGC